MEILEVASVVLSAVGVGLGLAAFIMAYGPAPKAGRAYALVMREHDPNFRPPSLPGAGWRLIAGGHEPKPGERYEVAVAVGLEGVQVFRDRCVGPHRFELIDYMAVVAFRELPR